MFGDDSRAQSIFNLREHFPNYQDCPWKFPELPKPKREPALDHECRQILAWTAAEATRVGDFWIDTEHLLLGILRVRGCLAERYLNRAGLSLSTTREAIQLNKSSRPDYGAAPRFWEVRSRVKTILFWGWP
jgi:ClpA/ClpB-like protein